MNAQRKVTRQDGPTTPDVRIIANTRSRRSLGRGGLMLSLLILVSVTSRLHAAPVSPVFTYQGRLSEGTNVASGTYDLRFRIYDSLTNGLAVSGSLTLEDVAVTNGLFTALLDFGAAVFNGEARWLEIAVRPGASSDSFTILAPRQEVTATPYALNALNLMSFADQPLDIKVHGMRALHLESPFAGTPSIIGGFEGNRADFGVSGGVIAGGGGNLNTNVLGENARFGSIGGGLNNVVNGLFGNIDGGANNRVESPSATIGGGASNTIGTNAGGGTIAGGTGNQLRNNTQTSVIGGGVANVIEEGTFHAVIVGGTHNRIETNSSAAVINGGSDNFIGGTANLATIGGGAQNEIHSRSSRATIAGGSNNKIATNAINATVSGGFANRIENDSIEATIAGGGANRIETNSPLAAIGGGAGNVVAARASAIVGGEENTIGSYRSFIGGGMDNSVNGVYSIIGGGGENTIGTNTSYAVIGGGQDNIIPSRSGPTMIGATVGGGVRNASHADYATVSGGYQNTNFGANGTIGGGVQNNNGGPFGTVGGGSQNTNASWGGTIAGGSQNLVENSFATVGGGGGNVSRGWASTVPGGADNVAQGYYSFAAGLSAQALHSGTFVWSDSTPGGFASTASNQFLIRARGGVGINMAPSATFHVRSERNTAIDNTATFINPFLGPNGSHIHFGTNGDWYIRSAKGAGKVVLQDSGGNVGVGLNQPIHALHVGNTVARGAINFAGERSVVENATQGGRATFLALAGFGNLGIPPINDPDRVETQLEADDSEHRGIVGTASRHPLEIRTFNTARITVLDDGRVGIGRVPAAWHLELGGEASKATAGPWLANSDARIKMDVRTVTNALETLNQVRLVDFRYTEDYRRDHPTIEDRRYLNVIAQEFQKVFPEHVKRSGEKLPDGEEILTVDTHPLTVYSAAAVQELHGLLKEKEIRISNLERRLAALEQLQSTLAHRTNEPAR
jgi:hypothetical protein